jgi:hypothetical protein
MDTYVCFGENLKAHGGEAVLFSVTANGSRWPAAGAVLQPLGRVYAS